MTLASEAIDWIERSMPPSMMTKVTPVARMNSTAVSLGELDRACRLQKARLGDPDQNDEDGERRERQPLSRCLPAAAHFALFHRGSRPYVR